MANILIIEDDAYLLEHIEYFVKKAGHNYKTFKYADDVIKDMDNFGAYNYIILDIMLMKGNIDNTNYPDYETGEILYRIIRKKFPAIKFIIISAKDFNDMQIDFKKEANVQTIQKPIPQVSELVNKYIRD